jgi:hypothetical protein
MMGNRCSASRALRSGSHTGKPRPSSRGGWMYTGSGQGQAAYVLGRGGAVAGR